VRNALAALKVNCSGGGLTSAFPFRGKMQAYSESECNAIRRAARNDGGIAEQFAPSSF